MKLFRKTRFFWVYPLVIWLFATASTSERSLHVGIALILLGEALRLWANGYIGHVKVNFTQKARNDPKIGRLITAGPYGYVRHPLYVGTFLIGAGFCVAVRSVPLALATLAFFLIVYGEKATREEQIILGEWGQEYAAYQQTVPRWLPTFRRYTQPHGRWSWQGIRASKELKTLTWVIVTLLAVYFREEWLQEHDLFIGGDWLKHVVLTICFIILIASDGIFELVGGLRRSPRLPPRAAA